MAYDDIDDIDNKAKRRCSMLKIMIASSLAFFVYGVLIRFALAFRAMHDQCFELIFYLTLQPILKHGYFYHSKISACAYSFKDSIIFPRRLFFYWFNDQMASSFSFSNSIQPLFFYKISFLSVSSLGRSQGQIYTLVLTGLAIKFSAYSWRYLERRRKGTMAFGAGSLVFGAIGLRFVSSKNQLPKALMPSRSRWRSAIS